MGRSPAEARVASAGPRLERGGGTGRSSAEARAASEGLRLTSEVVRDGKMKKKG
jgi:hypothetical protein